MKQNQTREDMAFDINVPTHINPKFRFKHTGQIFLEFGDACKEGATRCVLGPVQAMLVFGIGPR